jgi:hypothetical protein
MSVFNVLPSKLRQPITGAVPRGYRALLGCKPDVHTHDNPHKARILALATTPQCRPAPSPASRVRAKLQAIQGGTAASGAP